VPGRLAAVVALLGGMGVLVPAAPAAAHAGSARVIASDFRTRLLAVTPRVEGLEVRLVSNGKHVEVRNRTGKDVEVSGYSGEPYLRVTPSDVYVNTRSATAYTNKTLDPKTAPPGVSPTKADTGAPSWKRLRTEPVVNWHDHRTHWLPSTLPPAAAAAPDKKHRISNWTVNLTANGTPVRATGTLDYVPPPPVSLWWVGVLIAAGAAALAGRLRRGVPILGGVLALAAAASLVDGAGRLLAVGATGWQLPAALLLDDTYATLAALGALAAAVAAVRRRSGAAFALALAAPCLGVLAGVTHVPVFSHGGAPVPWSAELSRACIAATLGLSAGVALAGWLLLRAERTRAAARASDAEPGSETEAER
jgi:hypothetical protein